MFPVVYVCNFWYLLSLAAVAGIYEAYTDSLLTFFCAYEVPVLCWRSTDAKKAGTTQPYFDLYF